MRKTCSCHAKMEVEQYLGGLKAVQKCYLMYKGLLRFKIGRPKGTIKSVTCMSCFKVHRLTTFSPRTI